MPSGRVGRLKALIEEMGTWEWLSSVIKFRWPKILLSSDLDLTGKPPSPASPVGLPWKEALISFPLFSYLGPFGLKSILSSWGTFVEFL